ncbi:glycosyltransferase family 4 protein [Megalodesulfovibrio paquesii]
MKWCFIIQSLGAGGAERCAATLADYWTASGQDVTLATWADARSDFYSLPPAVRRVALGLDRPSAGGLQAIGSNLQRVRALRRVLVRERPEVALAFMPVSNCLLALAAAGLPLLALGSEQCHPPRLPLGRLWELARARLYGRLDAVACLTQDSADWVLRHTTARRAPVIPNPVAWPLPRLEPVVDVPADAHHPRLLLAVGRLAEQKGFDRLLEAFSRLAGPPSGSPNSPEFQAFHDWRLVILGEGPERTALEAQRDRLGLGDRVSLPGVVGNLGDWYAAADLYVMTSRFEGFGNTLAEALAHGLPAVAVDCETGPRDILRHELDGLLVPQDDPDALASALGRLMADAPLRRRFGAQAMAARERFGLPAVASQWEALVAATAGQDRSSPRT